VDIRPVWRWRILLLALHLRLVWVFGMIDRLKSDAVFVAGVILASAVIGFGLNAVRPRPLPWVYQDKAERLSGVVEKLNPPEMVQVSAVESFGEAEGLTLQAFLKLREDKAVVVMDARPAIFFGLGHVPGALSLPRDDFEAGYARLGGALSKERTVVVYCASETCEDAGLVRAALAKLGHARVVIFHGGWADWQAAGLAEEKAP
jgi:rhodanese-related sulfurtransferase